MADAPPAPVVPGGACFTYGSLMHADIMARVCGCEVGHLRSQAAWLHSHTRHPVAGQDYPGLLPCTDPRSTVEGVLYTGVDPTMLARLDGFEGEDYERVTVQVRVGGEGAALTTAWVYRWRADRADRLLPGAWDAEAFQREGRHRFVASHF